MFPLRLHRNAGLLAQEGLQENKEQNAHEQLHTQQVQKNLQAELNSSGLTRANHYLVTASVYFSIT